MQGARLPVIIAEALEVFVRVIHRECRYGGHNELVLELVCTTATRLIGIRLLWTTSRGSNTGYTVDVVEKKRPVRPEVVPTHHPRMLMHARAIFTSSQAGPFSWPVSNEFTIRGGTSMGFYPAGKSLQLRAEAAVTRRRPHLAEERTSVRGFPHSQLRQHTKVVTCAQVVVQSEVRRNNLGLDEHGGSAPSGVFLVHHMQPQTSSSGLQHLVPVICQSEVSRFCSSVLLVFRTQYDKGRKHHDDHTNFLPGDRR